jgi:hypothetical protein
VQTFPPSAPFLKDGTHKHIAEAPTVEKEKTMPQLLRAPEPEGSEEERKVHKLVGSRHAPGDWIFPARIISLSLQGLRESPR